MGNKRKPTGSNGSGEKADWQAIEEAYVYNTEGLTVKELAKKFGVLPGTLSSRVTRGGWAQQRQRYAAKRGEELAKRTIENSVERALESQVKIEEALDGLILDTIATMRAAMADPEVNNTESAKLGIQLGIAFDKRNQERHREHMGGTQAEVARGEAAEMSDDMQRFEQLFNAARIVMPDDDDEDDSDTQR